MNSLMEHLQSSLLVEQRYMLILQGLKNTVITTLAAMVVGLVLGLVLALIRSRQHFSGRFRFLSACAQFIVYILRGTPVLLQLLVMKNIVFANFRGNVIFIAILTFGINSGAYVSEIIRSGIFGIDIGQYEAGISLGFSSFQTLKLIIIPQALKNSMPALVNEFSALLKETAILGNIAVLDLTQAASAIMSRTFLTSAYFVVGAIYLLIVSVATLGFNYTHKKICKKYFGGR